MGSHKDCPTRQAPDVLEKARGCKGRARGLVQRGAGGNLGHAPAQDIKDCYRSASLRADNCVIFNIKGNRYRLVVKVRYQNGIVLIERVGTHAQYDNQHF